MIDITIYMLTIAPQKYTSLTHLRKHNGGGRDNSEIGAMACNGLDHAAQLIQQQTQRKTLELLRKRDSDLIDIGTKALISW